MNADAGPLHMLISNSSQKRTQVRSSAPKRMSVCAIAIFASFTSLVGTGVAQAQTAPTNTEAAAPALPKVADYWFSASYSDGKIVLDGYVPDEPLRARLAQTLAVDVSALELADGAPQKFAEMVNFGMALMGQMSSGRFAIRANIMTVEGVASNPRAFERVTDLSRTGAPAGVVLAMTRITPAPADPFTWTASRNSEGDVELSGYVPDTQTRDALVAASGDAVTTNLAFASGAPDAFAANAEAAIDIISALQTGRAELSAAGWKLTGVAATDADVDTARAAFDASPLAAAGASFEIRAAQTAQVSAESAEVETADPYLWSALKAADGAITLRGFVPDEAFRRFLAARAGQVASDETKIANGAPTGFSDNAVAGFSALAGLDHGELSFDGKAWSLTGEAATADARDGILNTLNFATDTESWSVELEAKPAQLPLADPYAWALRKAADGTVTTSGNVPTEQLQRYVATRYQLPADALKLSRGAPDGFVPDVLAAVNAFDLLAEGSIAFDGAAWSVTGALRPDVERVRLDAVLGSADTPEAAWNVELGAPTTPAQAEAPAAAAPTSEATAPTAQPEATAEQTSTYAFSARKDAAGTITLDGMVPAEATRAFFGSVTGSLTDEALSIVPNAPENFILDAKAGLQALVAVGEGQLSLDNGQWTFSAKAGSAAAEASAQAELKAAPTLSDWTVALEGPPKVDACREEVLAFAADNPILFTSASATMTEQSSAAVDHIAEILKACPDAYVYIEGHTDSDGDDSLNLALSVARAESVVAHLAADGFDAQRLYAVGYGESQPIADNDTAEGKRANRRIVFTIRTEPEQ